MELAFEFSFVKVLHDGKGVLFVRNGVAVVIYCRALFTDSPNFALTKDRPQNESICGQSTCLVGDNYANCSQIL